MRVKWTKHASYSLNQTVLDWYACSDVDICLSDLDKDYEGDVIDTISNVFGYTYLLVACSDNKIRKVDIDDVSVIRD